MDRDSELVQLKLNIETSVGESTSFAAKCFPIGKAARRNPPLEAFVTEAEYGGPLPLEEVGVLRLDKSNGNVVTGVIGEDVHIVGIRIIEHALKDGGFEVNSLGAQVSQEEFINAAHETNADAIFVSSFSGHAEHLVCSFRNKCVEAGLDDIILYIGGSLLLREERWEEVEKKFKEQGFDRVYPPGTSPTRAIEDLKIDISHLGRKQSD